MQFKLLRFVRRFVRSFLYFVFSKCGRCISRKIIPFCLCFVVLGLSLTVPSFAASDEGTDNIDVADLVYYSTYIYQGNLAPLPVTRSHFNASNYGYECYGYYLPATEAGSFKSVTAYSIENFVGGHEYNIKFKFRTGYHNNLYFTLQLAFYDGNGNQISYQTLYSNNPSENNTWYDVDLNFKADTSSISSGYQTRLEFVFNQSFSQANWYYLTDPIYLNDNDDESGLLHSIIEWLRTIRDKLIDVGSSITTGFSSLGTRIGNFFADLKQGFIDKLESVKTAITNAIDGIEQWFIDLKDNIVDGLKSLFIPRDGYFSEKKTQLENFFQQHFGALYQGPAVLIELLRKLLGLHPVTPQITFPSIKMWWQGEVVQLTDDLVYSWEWIKESSSPLHYIWVVYRGFVTVLLFVMFVNYLKKKYERVFGGGEGAE